MGTEHIIYKDDRFGELTLEERSNKLTLNFTDCENYIHTSNGMSPEELAKVFLKGLTVCSYWMDRDKFSEILKKHLTYNIF